MSKRRGSALAAALVGVVAFGVAVDVGPLPLGARSAHAIVGRPLTPMSYAGVARRTNRRAAYAGAAYGGYPAPYAAPVAPAPVAALPAGCVMAGGVYTCGTARYRPYYDGPNVVYAPM